MNANELVLEFSKELENIALLDIPPTILKFFGIAIPDHFDGRIVEEIFTTDWLNKQSKTAKKINVAFTEWREA